MLNRQWHDAHPMPDKATLEQRIAWHLEHAAQCGCRDMPESIKRELAARGIDLPQRPTR
ncbi:hypothetical protein [Devosia alba]|uniref:hypothetical protein n=1 Tax=Devosia alba TaxID=3152360 RepID=UPI0032634684